MKSVLSDSAYADMTGKTRSSFRTEKQPEVVTVVTTIRLIYFLVPWTCDMTLP